MTFNDNINGGDVVVKKQNDVKTNCQQEITYNLGS